MCNVGFSPVCSTIVLRVKCKDHEVVVWGHLIGPTSPSGLMNIHTVPTGGEGAFVNALFHSTPGECCGLSSFTYVLVWGGRFQGESLYMSPVGQCSFTISGAYLIRPKYGL